MSPPISAAAAAFAVMTALACHHGRTAGDGAPGAAPAPDSARGIVMVVGAEPATTVVLEPGPRPGSERLVLRGPEGARVGAMSGLEVTVFGTRGDVVGGALPRPAREFAVIGFVVRAADGVEAYDGTVARDGDRFYLVAADGTRAEAPHLPAALRTQVGARVYLVGALTAAPSAYGIIALR